LGLFGAEAQAPWTTDLAPGRPASTPESPIRSRAEPALSAAERGRQDTEELLRVIIHLTTPFTVTRIYVPRFCWIYIIQNCPPLVKGNVPAATKGQLAQGRGGAENNKIIPYQPPRSHSAQATREILWARRRKQGVAGDQSGPWGPTNRPDAAAARERTRKRDRRNGGAAPV